MLDEVSLRPVNESDLPIFFEQEQDPDARHMAAFTHRPVRSLFAIKSLIEMYSTRRSPSCTVLRRSQHSVKLIS